jgi:hypothetical protein
LLSGETGTGCQSFIIFITDGQDTDGDKVRCEKGYYTRSGYVPGKKCQYNWDTVWTNVKLWNTRGVGSQRFFITWAMFVVHKINGLYYPLIDKNIFLSCG